MEPEPARPLNPCFEQEPQTAEQTLMAARALEHWLAERAPERQRWRCPCRLHLDYCREQCCLKMMMTCPPRTRVQLNSLRVWAGIRVTKVMLELQGFFRP